MKTLAALAFTLVMAALAAAAPLHDAAEKNDLAAILALLGAGADPNAKDEADGWSPLHWAIYRGGIEGIAALLGAGADPNVKDGTYGWRPLQWAAYRGDAEAIAALLGAGADPNANDDTGRIPLLLVNRTDHPSAHDVLLAHMRTIPNPEFLLTAAANGDFETVIALLRVHTDPNAKDRNGWDSLHWAVFRGHTEATAALLGAGVDPNVKNNAGQTAMDVAKTAIANREPIIGSIKIRGVNLDGATE